MQAVHQPDLAAALACGVVSVAVALETTDVIVVHMCTGMVASN